MSIISICTESAIKDAATSLISGNLVAFPTETVYGLGSDATNEDAIARIYSVKGRPVSHPLIVHISSIELLNDWARDVPVYAIKLARAIWPGPMTLILPRTDLAKDFITGGQNNIAIRIPSHPIAKAMLLEFENQGGKGVVAPSANRFGKVSPTSASDVSAEIGEHLKPTDLILDGGSCVIGIESTIINCTQDSPQILRLGAVTASRIKRVLGSKIELVNSSFTASSVKTSGIMETHYAPDAKVFIIGNPSSGDGFIALSSIATPVGAIRLASPRDNVEYAQILYKSLRLADTKQIKKVFIVPPTGSGIALAINDRLKKARFKNYLSID
jgi:L-threonylcarbamoyladenylate synthase